MEISWGKAVLYVSRKKLDIQSYHISRLKTSQTPVFLLIFAELCEEASFTLLGDSKREISMCGTLKLKH